MLLVVGLGNPGRAYAGHRHNVGFMTVDALAAKLGAGPFRAKFAGEMVRVEIAAREAVLLKPMTFMNDSGRSVRAATVFFKLAPEDVLVIHDELDLPFGTVRLKRCGGHAGHNGLRSLVAHLGTPDFCRIRIGIGRPPEGFAGDGADFVLSPFPAAERDELTRYLRTAAEIVLDIAARGFEAAMNQFNVRPGRKRRGEPDSPSGSGEPGAEGPPTP
ncbi:MAG: aminoacyl-tRNA hydrolase [Deltaproteobacteria bacterium]|nr:aminoacyl-tRNA hydrolase [Deltaproteobacteria bacterium]